MNTVDRENSILASFLYADDMGTDKSEAFILNEDAFTSSYRRATASKINDETKGDKHYGYLFITIKDLTKGTNFESDYFDIETQGALPLSVINRMHDDLIKEYKNRIIKGLR